MQFYRRHAKPVIDRGSALFTLILLSPLLGIVAILIRLEDGGPAIFHQMRVGKDAAPFRIRKFRSMAVGSPNLPSAQIETPRLTRVGRVIRRLNIDELPQLFNVLVGDMSLIGPRPGIPSQIRLHALRTENGAITCRPGMTGWAQVNSYDQMSEEEKARLDGEYHSKLSARFDFEIFLKTFLYLLRPPPKY
jgi:O-antigen biosynthesis protein WbqP